MFSIQLCVKMYGYRYNYEDDLYYRETMEFSDSSEEEKYFRTNKRSCYSSSSDDDEYYNSEKFYLKQVKDDPNLIRFNTYSTWACYAKALSIKGKALKHIAKQDEKLCLIAVNQNGMALKYVHKKSKKICMAAVTSNGFALEYVDDQTSKICERAFEWHPACLKYVVNQTKEICLAAVKIDGSAIVYSKIIDFDICKEAMDNKEFFVDGKNIAKDNTKKIKYISNKKCKKICEEYINKRFDNTKSARKL